MRVEDRIWKVPFYQSPEETKKVIQSFTQNNWYQVPAKFKAKY